MAASGLGTLVTTPGSGAVTAGGQTATVDYTGWTTANGAMFDSSIGRAPFSVTLGQRRVIEGWEQGLLGMRVGETRLLLIPASLGYGAQGSGPIPPNAELLFEVTLRDLK